MLGAIEATPLQSKVGLAVQWRGLSIISHVDSVSLLMPPATQGHILIALRSPRACLPSALYIA